MCVCVCVGKFLVTVLMLAGQKSLWVWWVFTASLTAPVTEWAPPLQSMDYWGLVLLILCPQAHMMRQELACSLTSSLHSTTLEAHRKLSVLRDSWSAITTQLVRTSLSELSQLDTSMADIFNQLWPLLSLPLLCLVSLCPLLSFHFPSSLIRIPQHLLSLTPGLTPSYYIVIVSTLHI